MSLSGSGFPSSELPRTPIGKTIRTRASKACPQCQRDRKGCRRLSQNVRCFRCEELDHACDVRIQDQAASQASHTIVTQSFAHSEVNNPGITFNGSEVMPPSTQSLQHSQAITGFLRGRPLVTPEQGYSPMAPVTAVSGRSGQALKLSGQTRARARRNTNTEGTSQTAASAHPRQDNTEIVRQSLNKLGDMCAAQEMILFMMKVVIVIVRSWLGNINTVQECEEALEEALSHLEQDFESAYKTLLPILHGDIGAIKGEALKHFDLLVERWKFADGSRLLSQNPRFNLHQVLMRSHNVKNRSSRKIPYSVAFQMICTELSLSISSTTTGADNDANDLQETSDTIATVVEGLPLSGQRHRSILGGKRHAVDDGLDQSEPQFAISGCSLAGLRAPWLAQRLLNILPSSFFMGLSPFHLMLYLSLNNGFDALLGAPQIKMFLRDRDSFGMTLVLIAACTDDVTRFMRLCSLADGSGVNVVDPNGRNALALAARNNCQRVVSYILNQFPQLVTTQELLEAVDAGNVDIAKMLVTHYRDQPMVWTNSDVLGTAQCRAVKRGFTELSTDIAALLNPQASAARAVQSWNDHDVFNAQTASSSSSADLHGHQVHQPSTTNTQGFHARETVNGSIPCYDQATGTVYNLPSQSTDWSPQSQWDNTPSQDSHLFSSFGLYGEQSGEYVLPSLEDFDNVQGSNSWIPP